MLYEKRTSLFLIIIACLLNVTSAYSFFRIDDAYYIYENRVTIDKIRKFLYRKNESVYRKNLAGSTLIRYKSPEAVSFMKELLNSSDTVLQNIAIIPLINAGELDLALDKFKELVWENDKGVLINFYNKNQISEFSDRKYYLFKKYKQIIIPFLSNICRGEKIINLIKFNAANTLYYLGEKAIVKTTFDEILESVPNPAKRGRSYSEYSEQEKKNWHLRKKVQYGLEKLDPNFNDQIGMEKDSLINFGEQFGVKLSPEIIDKIYSCTDIYEVMRLCQKEAKSENDFDLQIAAMIYLVTRIYVGPDLLIELANYYSLDYYQSFDLSYKLFLLKLQSFYNIDSFQPFLINVFEHLESQKNGIFSQYLPSEWAEIKPEIILCLAKIDSSEVRNMILRNLSNEEEKIRIAAIQSLGKTYSSKIAAKLFPTSMPDRPLRAFANNSDIAIDNLEKIIFDKNLLIDKITAKNVLLQWLPDKRVYKILEKIFQDEIGLIEEKDIYKILKRNMYTNQTREDLIKEGYISAHKNNILKTLISIPTLSNPGFLIDKYVETEDPDLFEHVISLSKNSNPQIRERAVTIIFKMDSFYSDKVENLLINMWCNEKDTGVFNIVARGLIDICSQEGVDKLLNHMLKNPLRKFKYKCIDLLQKRATGDNIHILFNLITDTSSHSSVRGNSMDALRYVDPSIKPLERIEFLLKIIKNNQAKQRRWALYALAPLIADNFKLRSELFLFLSVSKDKDLIKEAKDILLFNISDRSSGRNKTITTPIYDLNEVRAFLMKNINSSDTGVKKNIASTLGRMAYTSDYKVEEIDLKILSGLINDANTVVSNESIKVLKDIYSRTKNDKVEKLIKTISK